MKPFRTPLLYLLGVCTLYQPAVGQVPQISVTFPGRADSVFRVTSQLLRERHYSVVRVDSVGLTVEALAPDTPQIRIRATHQSLGDSTHVTISAAGGEVAGLGVLIELANALRPRPSGPARLAPDGTDWPVDAQGRVGFLVLTRTGARWLKMKSH